MEGDAWKDDTYDALRFCDPNLGDSGSQWGGRNRKCCGITEAVPTISGGEFVQSFVCKHEVLAFDYDHEEVEEVGLIVKSEVAAFKQNMVLRRAGHVVVL